MNINLKHAGIAAALAAAFLIVIAFAAGMGAKYEREAWALDCEHLGKRRYGTTIFNCEDTTKTAKRIEELNRKLAGEGEAK